MKCFSVYIIFVLLLHCFCMTSVMQQPLYVRVGDIKLIISEYSCNVLNIIEEDNNAVFQFEKGDPFQQPLSEARRWFTITRRHGDTRSDTFRTHANCSDIENLQFVRFKPTKSAAKRR